MHLRCPHCQNPIELADLPAAGEITCVGCGSSFQLANFSTVTWAEPTNKRLGKFEVLGTVGHGAFGTVLKAHDTELDRIVAIKIPRASNVGADPQDVDRFLREARSVAQLRFPSIITIHEVGIDHGTPYLVCDFVEGITLADHLTGRGFSFTESAKLLAEVADALQYAHSLGVVHRDVKPSNIMIRPDGSPCVMDFGLAKRDAGEITMTIDGQILGTPAYMSPEQARGDAHRVGGRSDVYSLGVILYQLLTGELPFRGNKSMLLHQVLHDEPRAPRTLNDKIPRDLATIALKAMAKEPARRYSSAKEMADDLRRWLAGEPILARPVGTVEQVWRWCKRKPALATASGLAAFGLLLAFAIFAGAFFMVSGALDNETSERKKAQGLANNNELLAEKERKARLDADERRKKAETLAVQLKFEHAFQQSKENPAFSMLVTAGLLREANVMENWPLRDSLGFHLGSWIGQAHQLRCVLSHEGSVLVVAFSPDGKTMLTGSRDKTARLWDTATGTLLGPPLQHQAAVGAVAFSPDGKTVLTGSGDGRQDAGDKVARLWEVSTGKQLGPTLQHQAGVRAVAFSPDGKTMLTGSQDKTARLWETATGKQLGPTLQHQATVWAVAFSPNGKTVLTCNWDMDTGWGDKTARLWEVSTGKQIGPPLQHQAAVVAVAFSPDGKTVLTGSDTARLWETATGKQLGPPLQPQQWAQHWVWAVAFSPDGKTMLTGSSDRTARLWETTTGKQLGPPLQHQAAVVAVAFSPDGKTVLTGSWDNTARLWETATGKPLGPPLQHRHWVRAVAFSPDGKTVVTGSNDGTARLWEMVATGKPLGSRSEHFAYDIAVAFSPDGKTVVTGGEDKTARLWGTATGKPLGPPLQHQDQVRAVAFSPDGKTVLTGSWDKTARLWETATGKPVGPPLQHQDQVRAVAFSPDGKTVLTRSDGESRLWETATGKPFGSPLQPFQGVHAVAFSPDGKTVLTGSGLLGPAFGGDGTARLWETATGKPLEPPLQHQSAVVAVAFSRDGKTLLTGSHDGTARLWETATGKPFGPPLQHQSQVVAVAFSPDGKTVLTGSGNDFFSGSGDKTARLWETATGKPLGPPLRHRAAVVAVAFSPDGKIFLTRSSYGAQFWETATSKPLGLPRELLNAMPFFSPDGKTVLTRSSMEARLSQVPQPVRGDPERIMLWTQVITGLEVDELTAVRVLDTATWQQRRARLEKLGGPPEQ